jgi:hypothetical protein
MHKVNDGCQGEGRASKNCGAISKVKTTVIAKVIEGAKKY